MKTLKKIFTSKSEEETREIGHKIAKELINFEGLVLFYGDLGSGKTTLIRGICEAFGCGKEVVRSPSFTIVNEYECDKRILHVDLYRISTILDFESAGLFEILEENCLILIEWAEKLPIKLENINLVKIYLKISGMSEREIKIEY